MSIPTIQFNNTDYVDAKQLKTFFPAAYRGYRSISAFVAAKNLAHIFIVYRKDGSVQESATLSKRCGTTLIPRSELHKLEPQPKSQREPADATPSRDYPPLPPIINDDDLVFKDEDGREYDVVMRGERTPGKILFSAKCLAMVFQMPRLIECVALDPTSSHKLGSDYHWFRDVEQNEAIVTRNPGNNEPKDRKSRELYLTYSGLVHVIHASRTGIANQFRLWLEDIVFAAWFGTTEQRVQVSAKILTVCADQIAAIMGKCANNIACIYLIDIKRESDGRRVYKYGRTNNIQRRFREHTKTYGADIQLVKFGFIPTSACVQAENDLKSFVKDFAYQGDEDLADKVELIQLNDEERYHTIAKMLEIADTVSGNMREQLAIYTDQLKDLTHQLELIEARHQAELAESRHQTEQLRMQLQLSESRHQTELKDRDIQCLKAEHRAEQAEHRAAQAESELKILRLQLELAQLKSN